jgi:hypothetical protein
MTWGYSPYYEPVAGYWVFRLPNRILAEADAGRGRRKGKERITEIPLDVYGWREGAGEIVRERIARKLSRRDDPGAGRPGNDVYADEEGNVYRRTEGGWAAREGSGWTEPDPAAVRARERVLAQHGRMAQQFGLEQAHEARQRSRQFERDLRQLRSRPRDDPYSRSTWYGYGYPGHPAPFRYHIYVGGGRGE